jgi:hypothetical protein
MMTSGDAPLKLMIVTGRMMSDFEWAFDDLTAFPTSAPVPLKFGARLSSDTRGEHLLMTLGSYAGRQQHAGV